MPGVPGYLMPCGTWRRWSISARWSGSTCGSTATGRAKIRARGGSERRSVLPRFARGSHRGEQSGVQKRKRRDRGRAERGAALCSAARLLARGSSRRGGGGGGGSSSARASGGGSSSARARASSRSGRGGNRGSLDDRRGGRGGGSSRARASSLRSRRGSRRATGEHGGRGEDGGGDRETEEGHCGYLKKESADRSAG
jgi:hypothetical protein